jgi:hypothetical protein
MLFITWYQSQKLEFLYSHDFFPCTSLRFFSLHFIALADRFLSSSSGSFFDRRFSIPRAALQPPLDCIAPSPTESAAPVRLLLLFQVVEATRGASLLLGVYALLPHHRCDPIRRREPLPGPAAAGSPLLCFLALV